MGPAVPSFTLLQLYLIIFWGILVFLNIPTFPPVRLNRPFLSFPPWGEGSAQLWVFICLLGSLPAPGISQVCFQFLKFL